ncbi:MAG: UDP-N-acetylmuramoyl-L-alanyl-D-glutamate--2,6-diaminopimelate ligase [Steroidobacteraceae bacterium]
MNAPIRLSQLLDGIAPVVRDVALTDLALDSREVRAGGAFLACRGARRHGLEFLREVIDRGAAAVLWEPEGAQVKLQPDERVVMTAVPQLAARASLIADRFFASPSRDLDVIGVTGTNGKTTCAWLLAQALTACGRAAAYLGTLGAGFGGTLVAGELTTPDAVTVQRRLAAFRDLGARAVAMEVSSHSLAQQRVAAVQFRATVFTNLTRDHLDFHGDMQRYGAAKASLFEREDVRLRVFNIDDPFGAQLAARPAYRDRISCSRRGARAGQRRYVNAAAMRFSRDGMQFTLDSSFGSAEVRAPLVGAFNVDNLLAVLAVLLGSDVPLQQAVDAVAQLAAPAGRLESFCAAGRPLAVVDYAHTPDALEQVLLALRQHCAGRLICVFGCGGDRDRGKRPQMGAVAARAADQVILTDDNPRTEDPRVIVADIAAGMPAGSATVVHDRRTAILQAVAMAGPQDVVLVAGKGHETCQIVGGERLPFSDQRVVREALAAGAAS